MSDDLQNTKEIQNLYIHVYNITLEISSIINLDNLDKIEELLNAKDSLIKEINQKKDSITENQKDSIKEYVEKIKILDEKNIEKMKEIFNSVKKELSSVNIGKKAISAYKYNKTIEPRLIDSKE